MENPLQIEFVKKLLIWYSHSDRPMPWKGIKDPYLIWISEIILQQTRVGQGWNYYLRFKERFPDLNSLADANEDEVLKYWEGLGYYSRARNLHYTAVFIAKNLDSKFPEDYDDLIKLKGIGPYTAAAISSFAFSKYHAVVDGNVQRVLARIFNIHEPIDSLSGKNTITSLANDCIKYSADPALYNQAIMDFGATVCKPANPDCYNCPVNSICIAYNESQVAELPVKSKKLVKKERFLYYFIIRKGRYVYIQQRMEKDIWLRLFQFPLIETLDHKEPEANMIVQDSSSIVLINKIPISYKQQLTHQKIVASFCEIEVVNDWEPKEEDWILIKETDIKNYAFPVIINNYLNDIQLPITL